MDTKEREWQKVHYKKKMPLKPIRRFWIGFDAYGNERWFTEVNNGNFIVDKKHQYRPYR